MNNNKIVKTILAAIIIVFLMIIVLIFIYIYLWFYTGINDLKKQHKKNIEIELINRDENTIIFYNYLKDAYGIVAEKFEIEVKPDIVSIDTDFDIKVEFMEKPFRVIVDTENKNIYMDNFYKVLSTDPKFQHLYSEWVKKQVGIEDENVELKFEEAMKGARLVGDKPYIDFSKITSLENLEEQICENTHNLYLHTVVIDNFNSSNVDDVLTKVKEYESLLKSFVFTDGDKVLWFGVNLNDSINDKMDPYFYSISFDYNTNEKKYFIYYENRPIENNKSEYIAFE